MFSNGLISVEILKPNPTVIMVPIRKIIIEISKAVLSTSCIMYSIFTLPVWLKNYHSINAAIMILFKQFGFLCFKFSISNDTFFFQVSQFS